MESSLHRQLKEIRGTGTGGRVEVDVGGYRVDAVGGDGGLVEVQTGATGPLRSKLRRLLEWHRVTVLKPVIVRRRVVRRSAVGGPDLSSRWSPSRGSRLDVFDDLVGLGPLLSEPGLRLEVWEVDAAEVRSARRRRPGYAVVDRELIEVRGVTEASGVGLWRLIPGDWGGEFTTADLAAATGRPEDFARRVAYCLRHAGAAEVVGKRGNRWVYTRIIGVCDALSAKNNL